MIHIDADRGDKFLKKNQIAVDVGISPLNKAIALLSYSPTTETYRVSISFPDSSPLSLVDDYSWKAGKSLSDVSNFSATAIRQGGHVHWHSDGSKLIIFIHNRLHVFSFSWLDKTSEPPRYLLFPDVIFLVQSSYDAALRVPGGQIFDINQVLEVQWTVKANRRDIVGQHLFALTSSLLLLTQTDGFCLIDWHGSLLHHFPLNPLLAPAQAPEPTTPSEEVEDCRDLFRLGLLDSAVAMKSTVSPLNYELPSTSDDVALSRLDQVRSVVWLEGVQSFFLVFLDGSFALYSLPPSNSSSSTSNLLNSKVPASPQAPPTPSYYRGGAAVKKLGESALWALLTQKEELATTLAAIPINATPVIVATQPSYNPTRPPSTDVTTLPPPPPHSDVIGGVEALISQRIYFISQVAYPLTSSPSTAPVVYECSREGVYASPYITMKEVQHYCAFPPSVEKKLQRSPLLLEAKCVEEISKVNDVVSLEDLPIDALDLHSDVSIILLMTTRHFMDSDVTADESEEQLQHSRSSEGEDAPKPKPNLIPFMMTYSLVKVALLRSEEEESEVEAVSHSQPFSTPVKRMPNATVTVTSAPPLSPVRGRGRGRPQLRLRVIEVCNVARLHCLEQERYHSKLQLHYDSFQHESLLLTWIHLSVSARSTSMMKQYYFTVDLSLVSPDRPLHSSNNEVDDEEVILTKLATLSTSFLHLHHSLQHTRRSAMTFKTRVHRLPTSLHLLKPKQVNHSEVVEYDDVSRALLLPSIDQEAVQISYTETSSEGEAETEEVSRDLIRCHHSSARERVTLPKQLTQALHTHEAFCYHHSLTWHQLYSTSSSTPPLPSHRLATRATSSSLSLIPSNRLTSLSTPSLFVSISSKRNTTYVTSSPSSPHPMGSAIDRQVLHLSHEVDYVACIVGRKKAAISGAGSNQPTSSSQGSARKGTLQTSVIYFCQAPELWIFNQQTKRWRNTTLLVGLKEGRARLIKSIPPVHYHLILSSGDDEEVVEEEDQRKRQHSNGRDGREGQRAMTLSRSQSVGLDSSQYNFYLSASTLASDSTAFDDALHGLSVDVRGHNLRPASSDALLEEHNPPTPIAQQTRHPTIVIPQDSVERGAASKPPLRRPSHTTQRGVGGAVGAMTSRRRSDSDTSKSSDVTDATSSTTTGRRSRHRLRTSVETAVTTQGGAAIAPAAATSALSHLLSPTSSSSAATSSNNHLIASSLQVVALSWFDTHTIILLTLRKSIYYIEILSREILRDVYYNANPTANANNPHYNHYSVQPKLHKLIPLPIGFIPHHHDVINIVYPIHSTSSAESNSTHSFNPLLNGQTTPKSAQPPHHSNFAVVAVSDGKHFLAYQITARFLPAPTSVSELKSSATADTPTHRRQNSGGVFGDNAVRTSMTSMNASDSAKMLDNYSFLELFNFTAEEVHTPPSLTVPLSLKTMKIYVTQVPSSERQIAVFENLRRNYGDDHYIHYVSLLIVTESNEHLLLDAPLKTATSLTPPPQTPPTHPHNTPLEEVEVARLSSADFPLLHSPSSYQFNDVIAVHHPNHHTSQLRGYHHHLIDRLTHLKLLQRFGKKGNKEGGHVTPTPLSLPQNRDFLYSTAYLTSVSYDHYLTSQYLGQEAQQIENQRALLQLTLPLPLSSPPRRIENSGDEVVVEEVHGVCLLREGSAVLVSPSLSQLTSSLSKEVMKGVWPRQSTSRHSQQESLLFHLLTLLYERHRHLLIQHLLTTPSDTSSHPSFLNFPLMTTSSSLSSGEGEVAFVRQVVHSQLDFFHRSRQSSKLQHLLASLEHYAAQVIRQTTPHLLVPYTSSTNDNNQSSEKTSAKRERRQQQSHSLALPPQVEEYVRQHELYWFTSFCYELHPLLFLEVLTKLVRKLEPRQTHRLFPLCTHLSLTEHDSDNAQTTLSFHTTMTSVFEVMENALLPRHLVDYLIRYLSFLCEHVGGSDTLLHTFVCLFYVSEVFYQSIVTLALTKASDVMDFSLRLEDMLFQFNTLHQQKQQKKSSPMTSERESMKDVVMSRLETLKRHSRQSHYKHSLAMFQRLQHLLDNTTSTSTTSAQSLPQSPNGTTVWESLGVSWLLSSIGLTSSTTTSEEGSGNGVSRRRKKVVKMVQGSDVSHPSTPQPGTTSSTTFKSLELLEQFLSLERLNALLTHSLPQHPLIPPPSTPSLLEQLNTSSSTASLTKPSSLMWHLLGGVLYDWLVVQRKRLYHTVAFVLLSLLKSPKNERLLQHHLYLLLFTSPSNDDSVRRHCQQRLFPAHYDHLIGGASKEKTFDDVSALLIERYEVVSKIFIVLRMQKYVRRIRSLSVSIDTGSKKSAESRQLLREHQLTCLDYCQQPLPQQYLKKLVDVEYHHTSFTSLKQQKGVTSAPPQQRNPSLDEQSSHSQSLHRLEASLALLEPATSASTHGMGMTSSSSLSTSVIDNRYFPLYFESPLYSPDDDDVTPLEPRQHLLDKNCFYSASLWQEYVDKISLSARSRERRHLPLHLPTDSEEAEVTSMQLLRGVILAHLLVAEIHIPLMLLYDIRSLLHDDIHFLLSQLFSDEFAEDNSLTSSSSKMPRRSLSVEERMEIIQFIFLEFLFPNLQQK